MENLASERVSFAERHADQNEVDYKALQDAIASGRVKAATEATG